MFFLLLVSDALFDNISTLFSKSLSNKVLQDFILSFMNSLNIEWRLSLFLDNSFIASFKIMLRKW